MKKRQYTWFSAMSIIGMFDGDWTGRWYAPQKAVIVRRKKGPNFMLPIQTMHGTLKQLRRKMHKTVDELMDAAEKVMP